MKDEVVYDLSDERWIKNKNQIQPTHKKVILTFDDGPSRQLTKMLDILKEKEVQAIFFWQSKLLYNKRPWKRVIEEGHIIGSHAINHKNLTKLTSEEQYKQIKYSIDKIASLTGQEVRYFRPPFGQYNEHTLIILEELKLTPVMWEISSYDWEHKTDPETIVDNVVDHIMDGSIILLHELAQTVKILPQLIDGIRKKGFDFDLL